MSTDIESESAAYSLTQFGMAQGKLALQITTEPDGDFIQLPVATIRPLVRDLIRYLRQQYRRFVIVQAHVFGWPVSYLSDWDAAGNRAWRREPSAAVCFPTRARAERIVDKIQRDSWTSGACGWHLEVRELDQDRLADELLALPCRCEELPHACDRCKALAELFMRPVSPSP